MVRVATQLVKHSHPGSLRLIPYTCLRHLRTYAENPAPWQSDPCVQMYGQLLAVRDAQQDAFLVAAETLRLQASLPPDLRASASRTKASVLFQKAAKLFESLTVSLEGPWPVSTFDETLQATTTACEAYAQALAESADPDLCRQVEPHCPEWPAAVLAVQRAHVEVLKLGAELRFRQIRWYSRQAELARVVSEAAHGRRSSDEASRAVDSLQLAGLAPTVQEQDLWQLAANACDQLVAECMPIELVDTSSPSEGADSSSLTVLQSRGQALQAITLKDLAISQALLHDLDAAVVSMLQALNIRVGDPAMLTKNAADQIKAAAQGMLKLCERELHQTAARGAAASNHAKDLASAISSFEAWCRAE